MGVICAPADLQRVVESTISDGHVEWDRTEWSKQDREDVDDHDVRPRVDFSITEGVWYRSGRILVP
jgi:hypothetical protein